MRRRGAGRSHDLTVGPTSKLIPVRKPSVSSRDAGIPALSPLPPGFVSAAVLFQRGYLEIKLLQMLR
jgi:hypothetical protein